MRYLAVLVAVVAALASPTPRKTAPRARPGPIRLTILYTAAAHGQIRSCNCTKFRYGGYGRELTLVKRIREECPDMVLVEGGDAVEWTGFQAELKTQVIARALKLSGYDALVPGEDELGTSGMRLIERFDPDEVPIVCANLRQTGKVAPKPYVVVKTKGGLRVGLVGLMDESAGRLFQRKELEESVGDPVEALKSVIGRVSAESDVVVVVYHGPAEAAEKLAGVKGVDLILASHNTSREVVMPPDPTNEVEAAVGNRDGVVIVAAQTKANWSLGRIDIELGRAQGPAHGKRTIAGVKHRLYYLDRRYEEDAEMVAVYDNYNENVKRAVLQRSAKLKEEAEAKLRERGLNLDEMRKRLRKSPFATASGCKDCHAEICEIWAGSRHAHAIDSLKKTNQEFDPECVNCHVTGAMVRNGFANLKDTPQLANVQCEACHGPGLAHSEKPSKDYGKTTGEGTCRTCHTDERNPGFDPAQAWAEIMH